MEEPSAAKSMFRSLPESFTFSSGEGYSIGTVYISNFSGKFSQPEVIDDYTYSMNLEYIEMEHPAGEIWYENEVRYIYWNTYGFDNADQFYIYLPKEEQ